MRVRLPSARISQSLKALGLALTLGAGSTVTPADARAEIYEYTQADGSVLYTNVQKPGRRGKVAIFPARVSRVYQTPVSRRDHSPERFTRYDAYVSEAARLYQLPIAFIRAVIHIESNFDPNVVSVDGAMGLMQLMPMTANKMGVTNPFDPRQNILGGARFLRILANQWQGDLVLTLASYNAGAGAVERYSGVPPYGETRRYVNRVVQRYYAYRSGISP
jgi:soluble lytic murein transglycosylase-like protein